MLQPVRRSKIKYIYTRFHIKTLYLILTATGVYSECFPVEGGKIIEWTWYVVCATHIIEEICQNIICSGGGENTPFIHIYSSICLLSYKWSMSQSDVGVIVVCSSYTFPLYISVCRSIASLLWTVCPCCRRLTSNSCDCTTKSIEQLLNYIVDSPNISVIYAFLAWHPKTV